MATTKPEPTGPAPVSLVAKLAEVMGLMRNVPKEGFNQSQKYRYVREDDVARMASELLAARGVWIHQTVLTAEVADLYKTSSGNIMRMTTVRMAFKFVDGTTGESTDPQEFVGTGADTGDKGVYKAMTGAEKYFLMKSFLISTGDDPEGDEKVDKAAAATEAASGGTVVQKADHGKVARGGKTATGNEAQLAEVKRLAKELGVTSQADMMALVKKVLEAAGAVIEYETPEQFVEFMKGMTSVALGGLVVSLKALVEQGQQEPEEGDPEGAVEVKEPDFLDLD